MRKFSKKSLTLMVSLVLLLTIGVGGTIAFLIDRAGPVENTFTPSKITTTVEEEFDNGVKSEVKIKNTGDTEAFIRAAVVITWQNAAGEVYGQKPVEGTDYIITYKTGSIGTKDTWFVGRDDFYYFSSPVAAGTATGVLIERCEYKANAPEGYFLNVEILGSGVQSVPAAAVEAWSNNAYTVDDDVVGTADAMLKEK